MNSGTSIGNSRQLCSVNFCRNSVEFDIWANASASTQAIDSKVLAMAPNLDRDSTGSPFVFIVSVGAIQILGILAMILTGIWMGKYGGGFAWDGTGHEFNYHPLCMVISMVFLYSEGKTSIHIWVLIL